MDYFYLKLGRRNSKLQSWLSGANPLGQPSAPIYFDNLTKTDYDAGQGGKEPREFVRRGAPSFHDCTLMVVVHCGEVWVLKPDGPVQFLPSEPNEWGDPITPKAMPVEIVARRKCKDVPPVLASVGTNQYCARGTFRPLSDWGNFKAVDWVANRVGQGEHWNLAKNGADQLLECLGSTELETLVARLFEAHGCFVPAHRGGMMKDIDLFAHNDTPIPIRVGNLEIPVSGSVSIQVKRWADGALCPPEVDCLIGLGVVGPRTINGEALLGLIQQKPTVSDWLCRSLDWLPKELIEKFQLGGSASSKCRR